MPYTQVARVLKGSTVRILLTVFVFFIFLGLCAAWPEIDLIVSTWFYRPDGGGFFLADQPILNGFHWLAYYGARALGVFLGLAAAIGYALRKPFFGVNGKSWLFLFLGLLLAPGLIGNAILKDHWGRARPHEVAAFHGTAEFSPALTPQPHARSNGSFVAGDAAFGFYLPSAAYVIPPSPQRRRGRRIVFWSGIGTGVLFGLTRIAMGAHFLSDVLYAAFFMILSLAILHLVMYGKKATARCWREWFGETI